jgi:hypothetical protein
LDLRGNFTFNGLPIRAAGRGLVQYIGILRSTVSLFMSLLYQSSHVRLELQRRGRAPSHISGDRNPYWRRLELEGLARPYGKLYGAIAAPRAAGRANAKAAKCQSSAYLGKSTISRERSSGSRERSSGRFLSFAVIDHRTPCQYARLNVPFTKKD